MSLEVITAGPLTLLQDYGRYGYQHLGITQGGPMDEHAFLWANYLLNNHYNAVQLEINYGGFVGHFNAETEIALCGADLNARLNGNPISNWSSHKIQIGDELRCQTPQHGIRSYLAIKDGFLVKPKLNSVSTVVRDKLGGLKGQGQAIQKNDFITYKRINSLGACRQVATEYIGEYSKTHTLRFIVNPLIDQTLTDNFIDNNYQVSPHSDRMGYRLCGKPIDTGIKHFISQGLGLGAIQIPSDGQPIVLMKDKQTIGGYPIIGHIVHKDISLLAQCKPGASIRFKKFDIDEAEQELIKLKQFFGIPV